jgi:RNA methyltransferase, TrmH family
MLSKNKIKLIRSLTIKKFREKEKLFVAEGKRLVLDLLTTRLSPWEIYCTEEISKEIKNKSLVSKIAIVSEEELRKISTLKTAPDIIAIFELPENKLNWQDLGSDLNLVLDNIQDPGNLGTVIRLADWFGIKNIFCSKETADLFNPKTVQSTMGAIARVKVHYLSLDELFAEALKQKIPVYGTYLAGENLYTSDLPDVALIVMGNEGNGISEKYRKYIDKRINIPSYPAGNATSESLNVGVATSIVCAEFRRRLICNE